MKRILLLMQGVSQTMGVIFSNLLKFFSSIQSMKCRMDKTDLIGTCKPDL